MTHPDLAEGDLGQEETELSAERLHYVLSVVQGVALLGDWGAIVLGLLGAQWVQVHWRPFAFGLEWSLGESVLLRIVFQSVVLVAMLGSRHVYDRHLRVAHHESALEVATKCVIEWTVAFLGLSFFLPPSPGWTPMDVARSVPFVFVAYLGWRKIFHFLVSRPRLAPYLERRVLFLGWSASTYEVLEYLGTDPTHPYRVVGYLQFLGCPPAVRPPRSVRWLGTIPLYEEDEKLAHWIREKRVDHVVVADQAVPASRIASLSEICQNSLAQLVVIPSLFPLFRSRLSVDVVNAVPMLSVSPSPLDFIICRVMKRAVDVVGALVGLILSVPIVLVCGALIYWESPGPIFYRQRRIGLRGRAFEMIKLRSMRLDAEAGGQAGWSKKDDPRRLRIGAFLRRYNLDEVPQFWNVLKGEMSLVGPRPERPEFIPKFIESIKDYNVRHGVKPGMTGLAQIRGQRGDTEIAERLSSDLSYIETWSLWKDFKIMVRTFFNNRNAH